MSKVITVTSGKGGTGKSTVCAGLGYALEKQGNHVLILELDLGFRCMDIFFGIEDMVKHDLSSVLSGRYTADETAVSVPGAEKLSIICSPDNPFIKVNSLKLKKLLTELKEKYEFIIIDTGAGLLECVLDIADMTDILLTTATPDKISIRDAAKASGKFYEKGCLNQRLVINKASMDYLNLGLVKSFDEVIDNTGIQLIGVVPEDKMLAKAFGKGSKLSKNSASFNAFDAIARRIKGQYVPLTV